MTAPTPAEIAKAIETLTRALGATAPADDLVAYPFDAIGVKERAAARQLAARVMIVKLGRRRYAKRSALLDAVESLAKEQAHAVNKSAASKTEDGYGALVALAGGRR